VIPRRAARGLREVSRDVAFPTVVAGLNCLIVARPTLVARYQIPAEV
jgi:hypothetical protein